MEVPASIFRAYDIRGVVEDALTPDVVEQIGRAFAAQARAQDCLSVVVARDGRLSGPRLVQSLSAGLMAGGCDVIDIGMVPTPVLYFATHLLRTGTGIMVTGSHNPPAYNGLKMMIGGNTLAGDTIQQLYRRVVETDLSEGAGTRSEKRLDEDYIQRIVGDISLVRPPRIAIDCGNGVAGAIAPELFRRLGCDVTEMYCEVDGTFPNHHPDPSKPENVAELISTVTEQSLDLGLAFDGDGDRLGVIDDRGRIVWADRQMILFAEDVLQRNQGAKIVYDVKCTSHLAPAIRAAGGVPDMWKTGHSFIKSRLRETGALLGGEMSGHIFFKERWYGFDDALYAGARLLEILSSRTQTAAEVFDAIPDSINTPELNVNFSTEGDNFQFIERFIQQADFPDAQLSTIDGIRADYADGWGLVRASNTTPSLVIRFEAANDAALSRIQDEFRKAMLSVDAGIDLPF
ncbi:MAG: phosphomannomutase/phosphoglucomutase [Gammaproteobacteria bacterium]|nr:phosphomannomutase/phosphoglucomutase [Gammaproteobacteria bacterium]